MKTATLGLFSLAIGEATALIGYGISMYKPNCAFACRSHFASAMLSCSGDDHFQGAHSHGAGPTSPDCRAGDTAWLTTLAYCINSTCTDVAPWRLEQYWADKCTGDPSVQPKWTYAEALVELEKSGPPTQELDEEAEMPVLNFTALYNQQSWETARGTLFHFEYAETMHSRYGIVLLVIGFGTPVFLTLLGYLPFMSSLLDKLKPRFVYPSLVGAYHVRALPFNLGNAPTIGQTWYIAMFLVLNIVLTAVGYRSYQPNIYFANRWEEIMGYISARTGVLAFALAPLVILCSGRNNILLWLTNWSHSTYMLLHRWVARIFALQVILHSIIELELYRARGDLATEQSAPYWVWGIVATLAVVIMVVISTLFFRKLSYEIFLIMHIILAVFVLVGSWYHVELLFQRKWGYEYWIYAACAVWFADRALRLLRVVKNGVRRAEVTAVTEDIVRVDIKNVRWDAVPGRHTYAYFPMLDPLRPWENHPFSVIPTALLMSRGHSMASRSGSSSSSEPQNPCPDVEKSGVTTTTSEQMRRCTSTSGISLYVRKSTGMTKALHSHASLLTLLDGPYPNNSTASVLRTDRLVLIAGGIGITGILPFIAHHSNVKLFWSVKQSAGGLVTDLEGVLSSLKEEQVAVGARLDVDAVLGGEAEVGWKRIGVVVCGPGGLCDDVRAGVARRGRAGSVVWELDVEAFSW
ncbi:hypothetical protein M011DRAFT_457430 [Sporormia fimetaria CBS 119925]|uniref:Ferric oxidoreductase domain-containing protein n=1 Tax=Sporormia fimetaria CBS 119925 TaxID=1340428 RepID=A0A6A6VHX2_9PLEO|nr:hypothetical protein M011DRAFT_457430 [Sporormia fimetaria CBS 119925]